MDNNSDSLKNFEEILMQQSTKKADIYQTSKKDNAQDFQSQIEYNPRDIIRDISAQIKAIHNADCLIRKKCVNQVLAKHKTSGFVPINELQAVVPSKKTSKFETQFVLDTQLINVIEDVEAMNSRKGIITQEFEKSFYNSNLESKLKTPGNTTADCAKDKDQDDYSTDVKFTENKGEINKDEMRKDFCLSDVSPTKDVKICMDDNCTALLDQCVEVEHNIDVQDFITVTDINSSPVINLNNGNKSKSMSPLVYNLESFEKFEKLAHPIIEESDDIETAKNLINSQILGKELLLQSNFEPEFKTREPSLSPVLRISKTPKVSSDKLDAVRQSSSHFKIKMLPDVTDINSKDIDDKQESGPTSLSILDVITDSKEESKRKSFNFEDEILFSSDEELDNKETSLKELPFTCALETSFYDHSNVLDTTVYVGFQTASNKSIQVSAVSFNRAKSILDDETDGTKTPTLKELVESCDMIPKTNKSVLNYNQIKVKQDDSPKTADTHFIGFKTANGKAINILDKNIDKAKSIFKDIDDTSKQILQNGNKLNGFKTASNKNIYLSEKALSSCKRVFQDIDLDINFDEDNLLPKNEPCSKRIRHSLDKESSTSNVAVNLIEKESIDTNNIKIDEDILLEFEDDLTFNENLGKESKAVDSEAETTLEKNMSNNCVVSNRRKLDQNDFSSNINVGFKTASNKNITISEQALTRTKNVFQEFDVFNIDTISDCYLRDNAKCDNMEDNVVPTTSVVGFKTASNKEIIISEDAIAKSKNIFQDIEILGDCKTSDMESIVDMNENKNINEPSTSKESGFRTANNNKMTISASALAKTKHIFKDLDENVDENKLIQEKNLNKMLDVALRNPNIQEGKFNGFKTASNRKIQISDDALAKTKKIFEDINDEKYKSVNLGFQTASKKPVQISAQALARSKKIFEDLDKVEEPNNFEKVVANPVFKGFQTASKKEVKISADALARSKKLFENLEKNNRTNVLNKDGSAIHFQNHSEKDFQGFQTASNKEIKVSAQALAKSRDLFKDIEKGDTTFKTKPLSQEGDKNEKILPVFTGFQTASKKEVKISPEGLENSRKIFRDLSEFKEKEINISNDTIKCFNNFKGFQTASNKKVVISEDALKLGRRILNDANANNNKSGFSKPSFSFKTANNDNVEISEEALIKSKEFFNDDHETDKIPNSSILKTYNLNFNEPKFDNIDKLIDTQVIKNFEETLNTEDFRSPENKCKRSGSPILSCPKAKKRKFATPYKKDNSENIKQPLIKQIDVCDDGYKKNKKYTLKDIMAMENSNTDKEMTTDITVNDIKIDEFEFVGARNDISNSIISQDDLKHHFLKSVNKTLVPDGWFENHVKLILWKLLSYEVKFPRSMYGVCTAKNVLAQLKYRYFKELYNAERPALRKILERDDVASKTLVLCVRDIYNDGAEKSDTNQTELLLTDGWYNIRTCIDKMLVKYVNNGKIKIGTKLVTNGAELVNCEQGVAPWEDISSVRLKIPGNSTRRARWDARLGYHANAAILSHLTAVTPDGGKISKLRVLVARVYPPLYVEKFEDGSTVTRSERLEHIHQMKYESERQALVEKIYEEVEKEMSDEDSPESEDQDIDKRSLDSGSQIARLLKMSKEPSQFRASLTDSQRRLLEVYTASKRDKMLQNIQDKVFSRMSAARSVVPLLRVRVTDVFQGDVNRALLTIWKPNDAISELITEGACVDILNVVPTAVRYSELQLSAGRQTIFKQTDPKNRDKLLPYVKSISRTCYPIKEIITHPTMVTDYNEIDTAGIIIEIDPSHNAFKSISQFQNVYLTDEYKNIICVNFWGGIKKFGFENVLDTGQVVACVNLQKRVGNTRKNIPQYRATEYTYFTKTPKSVAARKIVEDLWKVLKNKSFVQECLVVKNRLFKCNFSNENISPYRFQNHDLSKNKVYIESPLARSNKITDEFNLSGLDFESTFRQTEPQELSPKALLRKKRVYEKISKLKMYGEPPPLSPINIINKSKNATKSFKSPLLNSNVTSNCDTPVANAKTLPENMGNKLSCSPVLALHRTLRKSVNPVKLDFSSVANDENDVDHFAEEFDASPPLSLD
ncbi:breast cancer type 2 susceptibility protein homolog [Amyelois transitella]|uniref:breast cancer type 2 susceptibility protein homolog n=1 Tax=Amyelois transitella TaxID=680683 RepID=UPI00067DAB2F|nr:breast cancer type 2 susceptibility protein homolog [Amyelois transitella]